MLNSTKVKLKNYLPLFLILVFAAFLRIWQLNKLPISLFGDEVDVGYHAWSLWTTGRDYMGQVLPIYIHSLSEWRAPLLMYWTAPFVGLMGPSTFSVRFPVALMGILNVLLVYLVAKKLTGKASLALISALILAITPWHIHYSRAAFEVTLLLTLLLLGVYWFLKALENPKYYFVAFIPFALTLYTYSTANVFTPMIVLTLLTLYHKQIFKHFKPKLLSSLVLPIIIGLPIVYQLVFGAAAGRFRLISIFNDSKVTDSIILARTLPWVNGQQEVMFHNKISAYLQVFSTNYLRSFSSDFLFLNGDPNFRQSTGHFGELLLVTAPFLILGTAWALTHVKQKSNQLLITWSVLAPIPSALTQDGGTHATRLFIMLPALVILTGLGIDLVINRLKNKYLSFTFALMLALILGINLFNYWHNYTTNYRFASSQMWNYGYESIFAQLRTVNLAGKNVYVNNTYAPVLIQYAFHTQLPPQVFHQDFNGDNPNSIKTNNFSGFQFGHQTYFGSTPTIDTMIQLLKPGDIYMAVQGKEVPGDWDWTKTAPKGLSTLGFVNDSYGNKLFYLVTKN